MSNLATRSRRTVPLDAAGEGDDHSISIIDEQSSSMQASGHLATPPVSRRRNSDHSRRSSGSSSRRSRGSNPQNYLLGSEEFAVLKGDGGNKSHSCHSRDESISLRSTSTQSIPMDEFKRFLRQPSAPSLLRPPSLNKSRTLTMTIGNSSNLGGSRSMRSMSNSSNLGESVSMQSVSNSSNLGESRSMRSSLPLTPEAELSAILPDLYSMEQALAECEEDDLKAGIERLYREQEQIVQEHQSQQSRGSGLQKTPHLQSSPIAWKTPFEVDAPRETPGPTPSRTRVLRLPGSPSSSRPPVRDMTDEQDAWAGIDDLLDTKSMDDSYCMSTTDILPRAVVRGMRRETSRSSFDESSVFGESVAQESVGSGASPSSRRSAESISKSAFSHSLNQDGLNPRRAETDADQLGPLKHISRIPPEERNAGAPTSLGGLFDMFHWSEKDNVDALRERKTKLNSQKHKISLEPVPPVVADDNCSLPSLASFRDDDSAIVLNREGKDQQTLVTERETVTGNYKSAAKSTQDKADKEEQQRGRLSSTKPSPQIKKVKKSKSTLKKSKVGPSDPASKKAESLSFEPMPQLLELAPFVPETQQQSDFGDIANEEPEDEMAPSSSSYLEPGASYILDEKVDKYIQEIQKKLPSKKNGNNTTAEVESPSPTSVVDDRTSPSEELPSLTSLSGHNRSTIPSHRPKPQSKPKVVEKKEAKPSSFSKLFRKTVKKKEKSPSITGRGDEKYFPKEFLETSKDTSDHCLLLQGDDGVNWD
jgi:hypothetical protein